MIDAARESMSAQGEIEQNNGRRIGICKLITSLTPSLAFGQTLDTMA